MKTVYLQTPIRNADIESLEIGDVIYLSGTVVTGRDDVHARVVRQNRDCPADLAGGAVFHAGPIVKALANGYEMVSVGPTTSMRMESTQRQFLEKTGAKIIIGKGGMGENTERGCREQTALHTVFPGGCAVVAARCVQRIDGVHWLDLGMPEAMWVLAVENLGPLIVSIDTKGRNLFKNNREIFNARKKAQICEIIHSINYLD